MRTEVIKNRNECIHNIHFYNMADLYDYLKSDPPINRNIFRRLSSENPSAFYGARLPVAIEYLLGGYQMGFDNFLLKSEALNAIGTNEENTYRVVRSRYGGVPVPALVAAGVQDCMLNCVMVEENRTINVNFSLSYAAETEDNKIINRGLATLFIVQALEAKGYIVNFNAFQISRNKSSNEYIYTTINLKQPSDLFLDIQKCYYPIRGKEFLRRILFRVLECSDVMDPNWGESYGYSLSEDKIREFLEKNTANFSSTDLIIVDPISMEIEGNDIYADTLAMIEKLKITQEFDVESLKRKIR